ncbi:hypothetical protein KZ829_16550 [Actinoplanes hulinensis]|uniref:Lipoprotein n=1 Tax=Actinoplanes hulinensis TaxID=1144547 RepID=A0ABS7B3H5_9ACTN|nr:hypothetical protein [Actinoplanes hulinensis]MBW6435349.1 hypothetical protein [Actinoplanes hulinensis]
MIDRRVVLFAVGGTLSVGGCAAPGATPPAAVPDGCDPTAAEVTWSDHRQESRLSKVTRFRMDRDRPDQTAGEEVLKGPFTPSISGVAAPADWIPALADSLSAETGHDIQSGPVPAPTDGAGFSIFGGPDPITEVLLYTGARSVSATFTVACDQPQHGTFTSWTTASSGVAACSEPTADEDPFAAFARAHCAAIQSPQPSAPPPEAIPFND